MQDTTQKPLCVCFIVASNSLSNTLLPKASTNLSCENKYFQHIKLLKLVANLDVDLFFYIASDVKTNMSEGESRMMSVLLLYLRLTIPQNRSVIRIPVTNGDRVRCSCPDKVY